MIVCLIMFKQVDAVSKVMFRAQIKPNLGPEGGKVVSLRLRVEVHAGLNCTG